MNDADVDRRVRVQIYSDTIGHAAVPTHAQLASSLGLGVAEVAASLARLASGRVIVLTPATGEIRMANPFSAERTDFPVECGGKRYYGNCVWDALGIPAMLARDGTVAAQCGDGCGPLPLDVRDGEVRGDGIVHFAVPASHWWDDIVFT